MKTYTGYIDPSIYSVLINAKECGWVPRPPSIPITDRKDVISRLQKISSLISDKGKLDLRFTTSLHERKHFLDLHLSPVLWKSFINRFHCFSQVFTIVNLLKGKKVVLPLYAQLGTLSEDNSFSKSEKEIIHKICSGIFSEMTHPKFNAVMETSATLLQYSILHDYYNFDDLNDLYSAKYYNTFYKELIDRFSGDHKRAFACYCFMSWFCTDYHELDEIERCFKEYQDYKKLIYTLLTDKFLQQKRNELLQDIHYLNSFNENFVKPDSKYFPDLGKFLSDLISFRKEIFSSADLIVLLLSDMTHFCEWITSEALKTYYIVDFGEALSLDTEITENYHASKWIVENQQFLFYDDKLGKQILSFEELDNLINIQLLSNYLINPVKVFDFRTKIASKEFLECEFY